MIKLGKTEQQDTDSAIDRVLNMVATVLVTLLLICHAIGGITAVRMEHRHIFSYGKLTAEYIKSQGMQDLPMVGDIDYAVSTVVGYLEKPRQVYYPRGSRLGSFVRWDKARTHDAPDTLVIEAAKTLSVEKNKEVLIILNRALGTELRQQHYLTSVAKFTGSVVGDEGFHLYLMPPP